MMRVLVDSLPIFRREMLRYRRDRAYWVGQLVFPLAAVAFIGFGLNDVVRLPTGTDYAAHLGAGMLALVVGSGGVGAGFTLIEDRQTGFLRVLLVAPVSRASLVLGKLGARVVASGALVAVLAGLFATFTEVGVVSVAAVLGAVAGITALFVALGVTLAVSLGTLESFRLAAATVTVPLYLLSGIFYPVATLPAPTRWLAHANPLTYGVDLLRYGLLGAHELPLAASAAALALLGTAAVAGAVRVLDRRSVD